MRRRASAQPEQVIDAKETRLAQARQRAGVKKLAETFFGEGASVPYGGPVVRPPSASAVKKRKRKLAQKARRRNR